ncbi:MAG: type III-B CRISPR module RAMP protein Cmr4 [Candidatus Diapherotrites archaeon]|nr:type III-B CRISPR module RAMP protein Cmr4 [Candidatus Diapherotrites archaeon]
MFQASDILFFYVETPLHAGTGAGLGAVDLPIQRERVTGYPLIQASSIKGVLRGIAEEEKGEKSPEVITAFGPEATNASAHAGAFSPGDARLLLFPVRSLLGIFAWTTSRHALSRFVRDVNLAGQKIEWSVPELPADGDGGEKALICTDDDISADGQVVLEEFSFQAQKSEEVSKIANWLAENALPAGDEYAYWRDALKKRLIILPEDDFREFTRFSTEVVTRVRLNEKKTVERGALWTEEYLPTDTLLYAPVYTTKPRSNNPPEEWSKAEDVLGSVRKIVTSQGRAQIGGNETIGRGIVALRWIGSKDKEEPNE